MRIIYNTEKKSILKKLQEQYGITQLPFLLIRFGKEKIRGYSGEISIEEIHNLDRNIKIELMGLYLFHEYEEEIRLSIEAIHLLKEQITKNILELTKEEAIDWFKGKDINLTERLKNESPGFKVLKCGEDFIGCGKLTQSRLVNYMPKERRIKSKK